jgi:hypothetical protein
MNSPLTLEALLLNLVASAHVETPVENPLLSLAFPTKTPAKPTHLTTTTKPKPKSTRFTHSRHTPIPTLFHSPLSSVFNQLSHTIHSTNKNNNFIIRSMEGAKCTS